MLLNTLSLFAIFFIIVFTSQTEGAGTPINILSFDTSNFKCEDLTKNDRLPFVWDWTKVGDKLDSDECFKRIAANKNLYGGRLFPRQLFAVARTRPGILTEERFCPIAREIVHFADVKDLATLEACGVDRSRYSGRLVATFLKNAGYNLTGIDYKRIEWGDIFDSEDIAQEVKQRLWLALVAILHERLDGEEEEYWRLARFSSYITKHHGIDFKASTPLTELETQIIRLLPVAIEYILSREIAKRGRRDIHIKDITTLYKALHGKIASNQALSLYLHSHFFINPVVDLQYELSGLELDLPPINDTQITKELFAYGNNLSSISDPEERRLATAARQQLEILLFSPPPPPPPPPEEEEEE